VGDLTEQVRSLQQMVKERDDTVRQLTLRMQSTGSDLRSVEDQLRAETQAAGDARARAERIVLFSPRRTR